MRGEGGHAERREQRGAGPRSQVGSSHAEQPHPRRERVEARGVRPPHARVERERATRHARRVRRVGGGPVCEAHAARCEAERRHLRCERRLCLPPTTASRRRRGRGTRGDDQLRARARHARRPHVHKRGVELVEPVEAARCRRSRLLSRGLAQRRIARRERPPPPLPRLPPPRVVVGRGAGPALEHMAIDEVRVRQPYRCLYPGACLARQ